MAEARIGKVTLKKGGAELRVLYCEDARKRKARALLRKLEAVFEETRDVFGDDLAGFVLTSWDAKGEFAVDFRFGEYSPICINTLEHYAAGALRREIAMWDQRRLTQPDDEEEDGPV